MNIERLFEMTYYLLDRQTTTAKELADHFGVSIRTIFRDIEMLESSGIPICTAQGIKGGIFLDPNIVNTKESMTDEDRKQFMAALNRVNEESESQTIQRYLDKLAEIFQQGAEGGGIADIDLSKHGSTEQSADPIKIISEAISSSSVLTFQYFCNELNLAAKRVCPVKLLYKKNTWMLHAFDTDRHTYDFFHIHCMSDFKTHNKFNAQDLPNEDETVSDEESISENAITLELAVNPSKAHLLYEQFSADLILVDNGHYILRTKIAENDWLYCYLLSFGNDAEVISPRDLRETLGNKSLDILKKYFLPS